MFDGSVYERDDAGKVDNTIQLLFNFASPHSQQRTVQVNVFTARQLRVEAGRNLDERRKLAANSDLALCRRRDVVQEFKDSAFASTIETNNAECLTALHCEADVPQRPEFSRAASEAAKLIYQRTIRHFSVRLTPDFVLLGNAIECEVNHTGLK